MKTKSLLCAVALMTGVSVHAQTAKDSVKVQNTNEVVVTGHNHRRIANGIASIPSPQIRRQSMNMYDLLARMMVPGLVVKPMDKAVETAWGQAVKVFIDGQAATDADIRALRPRDVLRVEYLQHPSDPQYQNASSAVNVVLRKYEYGGYALLSANQGFVNNYGDYGTTLKVDRKKNDVPRICRSLLRQYEWSG